MVLDETAAKSPLEIQRALGNMYPKHVINRTLYALQDKGDAQKTQESNPPLWIRVDRCAPSKSPTALTWNDDTTTARTLVFIDLDNIHDCFERAAHLTSSDLNLMVHGYCGPQYNHWTPTQGGFAIGQVVLHRGEKSLKDLGELMMFRDVLWYVTKDRIEMSYHSYRCKTKDTVILCSRDKSVLTMQHILQKQHHIPHVHVVQRGWDELKLYIE